MVAGAAGLIGVTGALWDDAWHTDYGRDSIAIPPHLVLYGGVLIAALVAASWGLSAWVREGLGGAGLRRVLADRALRLSGLGGMTVLVAAPVDNLWHLRYGRDAVLWSPPHMLGVAGAVALSAGMLAGLRGTIGAAAGAARILSGAGVLAALLLPVSEYDSDVPQFSPLFYLPVAAAGVQLGLLVVRATDTGRWSATSAALAAGGARVVGVAMLAAQHMSLTLIPPLVVPAVLDDLLARRGARDLIRGMAVGVSVPLTWWPALVLQRGVATQLPLRLLPLAVLGSLAGTLVVLALGGRLRLPGSGAPGAWWRPGAALLLVAALLTAAVATAPPALAHDPGQGQPVARAVLVVTRGGETGRARAVTVTADVARPCGDERSTAALVGRRAGRTVRVAASTTDEAGTNCRYTGALDLSPSGRWFIYVELPQAAGPALEAWVQLPAGDASAHAVRDLYRPAAVAGRGGQLAVGTVLYALVIALLVASVRLVTSQRTTGPAARSSAVGAIRPFSGDG